MGKSSGGGQPQSATPTSQVVTQTNLPEYAEPYFQSLMGRTEALSQEPYIPYGGQRVSEFSPLQGYAFDQAVDLTGQGLPEFDNAYYGAEMGLGAAERALEYSPSNIYSPYQRQGYGATEFETPMVHSTEFDQGMADRYMSPYQQSVTDVEKREADRDFGIAQTYRDSAAAQSDAFGGYRHAIIDSEAQRDLAETKGDIQTRGLQSAYGNAQMQYERDRSAGLQAGYANQDASLQAQNFQEQANQYGAQFGEASAGREADYAMRAAELNNRFGMDAEGLGLQAGQMGLDAAGTYGALGELYQGLSQDQIDMLSGMGSAQQAQAQAGLDTAYQDFVNQRDWERQQLSYYGGILRGIPVSPSSDTANYSTPSAYSQAIGLGTLGLGAYSAFSGAG